MLINKTIHQLIDAWNQHDIELLLSFYAVDFEGHDIGQQCLYKGLDGVRQMAEHYYRAFPNLSFTLKHTIVDGDHASLAWVSYGTHRGKIMNIPPTGRSVSVDGMSHLTLDQGKIVRSSVLWDVAGLLRNIGLLPDL